MKELSLNILDVAKNSVVAGATLIEISINTDDAGMLTLVIKDDGCGMSEETVKSVTDPFYTTRTTRKVGMGIPLLKLASEQAGGALKIVSSQGSNDHGTTVTATFDTNSIDFMPLGDIVSTVCILIAGSPEIDFLFADASPSRQISLDTRELREVLAGVSLAEPDVQLWIKEYLNEQYA